MKDHFNEKETVELLGKLANIASPSGYTMDITKFISGLLEEIGVQFKQTNKGALIVTISGKNNKRHRLLTAHVDTLGAIVKVMVD